ncbi:hypothetical protein [Nocardia sp. SSK8]|uniref:hypothetical protein n=1 Tax=Nocardia sp. SSK8 TaxID=3120154 RepID=UPI00300856DA
MNEIDVAEVSITLAQTTGQAAALGYEDWTYGVSTRVKTAPGVSTWDCFSYRDDDGTIVDVFDHKAIGKAAKTATRQLLEAQGDECTGVKCTVARSGQFRIEYSFDFDESIRWANPFFSKLTDEEVIENVRPRDF